MSEIALPDDVAVIDAAGDPAQFVVQALDRAKAWLAQATTTDLPEVVENKRRAEAIRSYMAQKELGKDAELAAAEIVRRAERRMGVLIREGQEAGDISTARSGARSAPHFPEEFATHSELSSSRGGIYAMTDGVSEEQFEEAVDEAREEKNMSRANVVRKLRPDGSSVDRLKRKNREVREGEIRPLAGRGFTSHQIAERLGLSDVLVRQYARDAGISIPADAAVGKRRRPDADRIAAETVSTLDGAAMGVGLIDDEMFAGLDPDQLEGWVDSLSRSLPALTRFHKRLKEMTRDEE